jgi:hypothetical protein
MTDCAKRFRDVVAERSRGRRPGGRYPRELREVALHHLRQVRYSGSAAANAARDLGIDPNTLRGWEKLNGSTKGRNTLQRVKVVNDRNGDMPGYLVLGPAGVRVEVHEAENVAALFRALA